MEETEVIGRLLWNAEMDDANESALSWKRAGCGGGKAPRDIMAAWCATWSRLRWFSGAGLSDMPWRSASWPPPDADLSRSRENREMRLLVKLEEGCGDAYDERSRPAA